MGDASRVVRDGGGGGGGGGGSSSAGHLRRGERRGRLKGKGGLIRSYVQPFTLLDLLPPTLHTTYLDTPHYGIEIKSPLPAFPAERPSGSRGEKQSN